MNINNLANKKIWEIEKIIKDVQILTNRKLEENENNIKFLKNEFFEIKKLINKNNS